MNDADGTAGSASMARRARRIRLALALIAGLLHPELGLGSEEATLHEKIVEISDLQTEALTMRANRIPMLLLISQEHCPFCVQIKSEILNPMIRSGDYDERVMIREIFIDLGTTVTNFSGEERKSVEFAHNYGVDLTPTLLILDSRGRELSKRLIGLNTPEMFSYYVDRALEDAIEKLR